MQVYQSEVYSNIYIAFYSFDPDSMTLTLKLYLNMIKIYLYTENEVPSQSSS